MTDPARDGEDVAARIQADERREDITEALRVARRLRLSHEEGRVPEPPHDGYVKYERRDDGRMEVTFVDPERRRPCRWGFHRRFKGGRCVRCGSRQAPANPAVPGQAVEE